MGKKNSHWASSYLSLRCTPLILIILQVYSVYQTWKNISPEIISQSTSGCPPSVIQGLRRQQTPGSCMTDPQQAVIKKPKVLVPNLEEQELRNTAML